MGPLNDLTLQLFFQKPNFHNIEDVWGTAPTYILLEWAHVYMTIERRLVRNWLLHLLLEMLHNPISTKDGLDRMLQEKVWWKFIFLDGSGGFGACSVFGVQNPLSPGLMVAKGGKCLHPSFALPFIFIFPIFLIFLNNFFLSLQRKMIPNIGLVWRKS